MTKPKRKIAGLSSGSLLVAFLILAFALSACGDNTVTKGVTTTTQSAKTATTAAATQNGTSGTQVATLTLPAATTAAANAGNQQAGSGTEVAGGEAGGGDEPVKTFVDPAGQFSFQHAQSWGNTTKPGETIRFTGRDEFISITITNTNLSPLDFGKTDAAALTTASPAYKGDNLKLYQVAGTQGAVVSYSWQNGPSPVTGKMIPSSARRYYIPGSGGKLAIFTYSSPTNIYDPAGADDFANAFKWLK